MRGQSKHVLLEGFLALSLRDREVMENQGWAGFNIIMKI